MSSQSPFDDMIALLEEITGLVEISQGKLDELIAVCQSIADFQRQNAGTI